MLPLLSEDMLPPPSKRRRISPTKSNSDSSRTRRQHREQPLSILPDVLIAYILQYCSKRDFFLFGRVAFKARQMTRNPEFRHVMQCHAFLDRFHDYEQQQEDSCVLMAYHLHLRFFSRSPTNDDNTDVEMEVDEKLQEAQQFPQPVPRTPFSLRTPVKWYQPRVSSPVSTPERQQHQTNLPGSYIPATPPQVSNRMLYHATPPRSPHRSSGPPAPPTSIPRRRPQPTSSNGYSPRSPTVMQRILGLRRNDEKPALVRDLFGNNSDRITENETDDWGIDDDAKLHEVNVEEEKPQRHQINHPFRQLRHLVHTLEFEFSDAFWKDVGLGENPNFMALFKNARRLLIYDSERGRDLDPTAFDWPRCEARNISADAAVLHAYALNKRHFFPPRVKCKTWGELRKQAEFVWSWNRQSRALSYETEFEIDVEIPRIMDHNYIESVSEIFGDKDFPRIGLFSTNICNYQDSSWDGTLVLPATPYIILNYEHTFETQKQNRALSFARCIGDSISIDWDIKWCRRATNARFMVKFFESLGEFSWGNAPDVWININEGDYKKVEMFLRILKSDLGWCDKRKFWKLKNIVFSVNCTLKNLVNEHHEKGKEKKINDLCEQVKQYGIILSPVFSKLH